ncbi:MAG: DUF3015 family protein [Myxococcota bacterium]
MNTRLFIYSALIASLPAVAHADPYGTAGCGLGSLAFGDKPGIVQTFAATTNATFGTQTFGITSGTSNCQDGGEVASVDQAAFMQVNYGAIQKESAEGQGEHLVAMGVLLGCSNDTQGALFQTLQSNHEQIFSPGSNHMTALSNIKSAVKAQPSLAESCTRI